VKKLQPGDFLLKVQRRAYSFAIAGKFHIEEALAYDQQL